jgi:hypothetical protein
MARRKSHRNRKSKSSPAEYQLEGQAQAIVERLRRYHKIGLLANQQSDLDPADFALKHGLGIETLRKVRAFARAYSKTDLEHLCNLTRSGPNSLPLHWAYVPALLTVSNRTRRRALEKQAAKLDWTARQLHSHIKLERKKGSIAKGGRSLRIPVTIEGCVEQIQTEGRRWRLRAQKMAGDIEDGSVSTTGKPSPERLRQAVKLLKGIATDSMVLAKVLAGGRTGRAKAARPRSGRRTPPGSS